ncbi:hypothetical protein OKW98_07175 [Pseudomonas sp. KU26590]|uniref:hypothetical protein n=1 Tax=Pseudomonas sp. KU26590 TaxID=2991051 RepID=UPI00223D2693|nr:hypothetical protein [Pseudomonas sp. KU26590]UZJ61494.1 hypothetical protein OKW98_07175 [Pseudomonas sp. KU26590]
MLSDGRPTPWSFVILQAINKECCYDSFVILVHVAAAGGSANHLAQRSCQMVTPDPIHAIVRPDTFTFGVITGIKLDLIRY